MSEEISRRTFVAGSLLSSAGVAIAGTSYGAGGSQPASPPTPGTGLSRGKIGNLKISRLILGGNLLTHFTHSRDLRYVYSSHRPLQHGRKDPGDAGDGRGAWHQCRDHAQSAASDVALAALPQGAGRQDPMDHLPHGCGRAGPGRIPPARRGLDQGRLRSDLPVGCACGLAGGPRENRFGRGSGRVAEEIRRARRAWAATRWTLSRHASGTA